MVKSNLSTDEATDYSDTTTGDLLNNVDVAPGEWLLFLRSDPLTQAKLFFGFALALPTLPAAQHDSSKAKCAS